MQARSVLGIDERGRNAATESPERPGRASPHNESNHMKIKTGAWVAAAAATFGAAVPAAAHFIRGGGDGIEVRHPLRGGSRDRSGPELNRKLGGRRSTMRPPR